MIDLSQTHPAKHAVTALSSEEFASGLALFRERTNLVQCILEWFAQWERTLPACVERDRFQVLSVGAGSGHFDIPAIELLVAKLNAVDYHAVEPNAVLGRQIVCNFESRHLENVTLDVYPCFFEDFTSPASFDLIHFTNSISLIPEYKEALAKSLKMLNPGGQLLIVHFAREGYQDLRLQLSSEVTGYRPNVLLPEEIDAALNSLDVEYTYEQIHSEADVSECFAKHSRDGESLLNFILACKANSIGHELKDKMLERMKSICTVRDGHSYMPHSVGVHLIRK